MHDRLIQLNAEYAASIDDDRLEDWPGFFTENCLYRVTTRDNYRRGMPAGLIYADTRDMLADRVLSLRKANVYETQSYRHVIGMPRILPAPSDRGPKVATSFVVMRINRQGHTDIFASGEYLDIIETHGDAMLLRERDVVCDSSRIDTLLALPL